MILDFLNCILTTIYIIDHPRRGKRITNSSMNNNLVVALTRVLNGPSLVNSKFAKFQRLGPGIFNIDSSIAGVES